MDVEELIEQVELYPVLYDLSNEKYKNSEQSERVWKKIAKSLQAGIGNILFAYVYLIILVCK